jgi:hypothetical protein
MKKNTMKKNTKSLPALTLANLATEIAAEYTALMEETNTYANASVQRTCRFGTLFNQAKDQCAHGEWHDWLEGNFPALSARTVAAYMRIAEICAAHSIEATILDAAIFKSILKIVTPGSIPSDKADAAHIRAHLNH